LFFDLVFHAEAFAFDGHCLGVMKQAVEYSGGEGAVVVEDLWPFFKYAICRDDCRAVLVTLADDLCMKRGRTCFPLPAARFVQKNKYVPFSASSLFPPFPARRGNGPGLAGPPIDEMILCTSGSTHVELWRLTFETGKPRSWPRNWPG
jgi:hypothetical protein